MCRKNVLQKGRRRGKERGGELEGTGFSRIVMGRLREQGKGILIGKGTIMGLVEIWDRRNSQESTRDDTSEDPKQ